MKNIWNDCIITDSLFEYSDEKKLKEILKLYSIKYRFKSRDKYFSDDREMRNIYNIQIRNLYTGELMSFKYGDSMDNTVKGIKVIDTYSILCCIKSDFYAVNNYNSVNEFMNEYGYANRKTAQRIMKAIEKGYEDMLRLGFDDEMVEALPD